MNGLTWGAIKSVKSINPCKSLPTPRLRQTGVVQTIYDIVKAHGVELNVETKEGGGAEFIIES